MRDRTPLAKRLVLASLALGVVLAGSSARSTGRARADDPPASKKVETAWKKLGVGSVIEIEETRKEGSILARTTTTVLTVVRKDDKNAYVKVETKTVEADGGSSPATREDTCPFEVEAEKTALEQLGHEKVQVGAKEYDCVHERWVTKHAEGSRSEHADTFERWRCAECPVPLKTLSVYQDRMATESARETSLVKRFEAK